MLWAFYAIGKLCEGGWGAACVRTAILCNPKSGSSFRYS